MPAAATVVSFNDALLRTADVQLLDSGQWLNDNVVQYVIERFNANQLGFLSDSAVLVGGSVAYMLAYADDESVKSQVKALKVDEAQIVCALVNDSPFDDTSDYGMQGRDEGVGSHWSLLVFVAADDMFYHYDSLCGHAEDPPNRRRLSPSSSQESVALRIATALAPHLRGRRGRSLDDTCWAGNCISSGVPRQRDGWRCGWHSLATARAICNAMSACHGSSSSDAEALRCEVVQDVNNLCK